MKHYKSVEFLSNLNVKPPLRKRTAPHSRLSSDGSGHDMHPLRLRDLLPLVFGGRKHGIISINAYHTMPGTLSLENIRIQTLACMHDIRYI